MVLICWTLEFEETTFIKQDVVFIFLDSGHKN